MTKKFLNMAYALALSAAMLSGAGFASAQAFGQTVSASKSPVSLSSDVKIERVQVDASGNETTVLREPKDVIVVPGDRVLFTLNVVNTGAEAASGFRATNPIPAPVAFSAVSEAWAEVSVDGGATWGKLAAATVTVTAGEPGIATTRAATAEDVTHVRWVFADPIPPGAKIAVSYRGAVK